MTTPSWKLLPPDTRIGDRYRIVREIGSGGYGSVYEGYDERLSRTVAIKVLHALETRAGADLERELRDRFVQEAKIMGRIHHPNFVEVYDIGLEGRRLYLVMELVEGRNLGDEVFKAGPIPPARAIPLFVDALRGLGEGHNRGIIHKDLKPDNLLLTRQQGAERLKILDFGVARVMHEDRITQTGLIVGTPQYFAPEYLSSGQVTPALDVYQMALILVEVLSGNPCVPENLTFMQMCNVHFKGRLDIPVELTEGEFGYIIRRATALDPTARYHDASHFAQALSALDPSSVRVPQSAVTDTPALRSHTTYGEFDLRDLVPTASIAQTAIWTDVEKREVQKQLAADRKPTHDTVTVHRRLRVAVVVAAVAAIFVLALVLYLAYMSAQA